MRISIWVSRIPIEGKSCDSDFRAQWKISVVGASKDFCAPRARVPPRGTSAEVGHTTPGLRSSQSIDRGYPCFSPIGAVLAACFTYTKTIGKSNMLLSKGPVPLGNCPLTWAHDLSLDFAAWQTTVRCVAFYHSLLSERSFSIGLPDGHPNPYPSRTPLSPHMKHSVDPSTPSLYQTIRRPPVGFFTTQPMAPAS